MAVRYDISLIFYDLTYSTLVIFGFYIYMSGVNLADENVYINGLTITGNLWALTTLTDLPILSCS